MADFEQEIQKLQEEIAVKAMLGEDTKKLEEKLKKLKK